MIVFRSLNSKQCVNIFDRNKIYRKNLITFLSIYGSFHFGKCFKYAFI